MLNFNKNSLQRKKHLSNPKHMPQEPTPKEHIGNRKGNASDENRKKNTTEAVIVKGPIPPKDGSKTQK